MGEERINRDAELFALPRHDVDGVMQKRAPDFRGRFRHEDARIRLAPHQDRQRADVILVRMRDQNGVDVCDRRSASKFGSASSPTPLGCMPQSRIEPLTGEPRGSSSSRRFQCGGSG